VLANASLHPTRMTCTYILPNEHFREIEFNKLIRWVLRLTKLPNTSRCRLKHCLSLK
jgi:hypothetical protein